MEGEKGRKREERSIVGSLASEVATETSLLSAGLSEERERER